MWLQILLLYSLWIGLIVAVGKMCVRSGSVGLPLAYLIAMSFMHVGAVTYAHPGYSHERHDAHWYLGSMNFTSEVVLQGTFASFLSVVGLAIGCFIINITNRPARVAPPTGRSAAGAVRGADDSLLLMLLAMAALSFVLTAFLPPIPSIQSLINAGRNMAIVGVCLGLWLAISRADRPRFFRWIALAALVPAAYLIFWGFLSYGFMAVAVVIAFWVSMPRRKRRSRWFLPVFFAVGVYLLLSIFVSYMEVRDGLRDVLWSETGFRERIAAILTAASAMTLLNPLNFAQLDWLNIRLNQNIYIGKAIWWHELNPNLQQNGATLLYALTGWIPRFLWPGKPEMGGTEFISEHTGMVFSSSATFGSGPVFELIVNYGYLGVFFGFIAFGAILRSIDRAAWKALRHRNHLHFMRGFLVGTALINPMSTFFFLVGSAVSSFILGTLLMIVVRARAPAARPVSPARL